MTRVDKPTDLDRRIGEQIAEQRRRANMTQTAVARAAGRHRNTVLRLERGSFSPTIGVLQDICAALGLSVSELAARAEAAASDPRRR